MNPTEVGGALVAASAALTACGWLARRAWRGLQGVVHAVDVIVGTADRPGIIAHQAQLDARVSANTARLGSVVEQLTTLNGGSTLRAMVATIDRKADDAHTQAHHAVVAVRESVERGTAERRVIVEAVDGLAFALGNYALEQDAERQKYLDELRAQGLVLTRRTDEGTTT